MKPNQQIAKLRIDRGSVKHGTMTAYCYGCRCNGCKDNYYLNKQRELFRLGVAESLDKAVKLAHVLSVGNGVKVALMKRKKKCTRPYYIIRAIHRQYFDKDKVQFFVLPKVKS